MTETEAEILARAEEMVRDRLRHDSTGHDWWHVRRVLRLAVEIGKAENADLFIVQLAALLHDVDDYKISEPAAAGTELPLASLWMDELGVAEDVAKHVREIIHSLSYKGSDVATPMRTVEGMVVQDADRLDAIGAIGIARAFAYGGARGRALYDPDVKPSRHRSFEEYKRSKGPTINHFYEKLLLLKELMNTNAAKSIAEVRHDFLTQFLERFFIEWEGGDG